MWYSFDTPGLYTIKPTLTAKIKTRAGELTSIAHGLIQVTVVPRNEERLRRRAKELVVLAGILTMGNITSGAEILSYFKDAAAVPSLQGLLTGQHWLNQPYAIRGLERIADYQSVSILIEQYNKEVGIERRSLRMSLYKIGASTRHLKVATLVANAIEDPSLMEGL